MRTRCLFSALPTVFFVSCAFLFYPYIGLAQQTSPAFSTDTTEARTEISAIPLARIGTETEITLGKIRDIRSKIRPTALQPGLDTLIRQKLEKMESLKNELDLGQIGAMNLRQIQNLKTDISQLRMQLDGWRGELVEKTVETNAMKTDLDVLRSKWEKTLALDGEAKIPQQVTERIQTNINELDELDKDLTAMNNVLLTKQDELTGALIYLDEVLNVVDKTEQELRAQIFALDSPPVWKMFNTPKDTITLGQELNDIITAHNNNFRLFTKNYRASMYYHILFFVILLFLSYYLKSEVAKWSNEKKDEAIRSSLHVISRPFSASLLVTLLVTGIFYSEAPDDVLNYFYALLVWPVLTIVPGLIPGIEKRYFYFVGGVFVFTQLADYFSDIVVLDRTFLFLLDLITIVLIISLIRKRKHIMTISPNVSWRFAFSIMRLSIFLLGVSVLANSVGNSELSKLLSQGSLTMIYGGTIIYASALVLRGLFALSLQHDKVSKLNMVKNYSGEVKVRAFQIIRWLAALYWFYVTLSGYLVYEPLYGWFAGLLAKEWQIGSIILSLGSILAFFVTLWISLLISRFIRFLLQDEIFTHFEMPRGVPGAISMIVRLVLITVGFVLAFGAAKIDMSNVAIIFGALGVGIGFGLQNIFNNLASGLILAFERPIQVGDVIQISNLSLMGEVKEIGIRASTVRTFDGAEVVVPNGNLISNEMINWTLSDHRRRQEIIVGVAYGTDTNKVLEILNRVVPEQQNVLKNPSPFIIFTGFGESSLDFRVLFWTHFDKGLSTKSAVGIAIDKAFSDEGIEIPFPQRDLHVRSIGESVDFQIMDDPLEAPGSNKRGKALSVNSPKKK